MNKFLTFLKSRLIFLKSTYKSVDSYLYLLIYGIFFLPTVVMAEGSKEIYVGSNPTGLLFCNNFLTQCNNGSGDRSQFAIYECDSLDRLNIVVNSTDEIVYLGFNGHSEANRHIVYRIKDNNGNIVKPEASLPTGGTGYINTINEARLGSIALGNPSGYESICTVFALVPVVKFGLR